MIAWIFLSLLITKGVFTTTGKCFKNEFVGDTVKQHFKLYGDGITLLPLKVSYSKRASHQISSHVLRILLEELLGYEDVVLVPDNSGLFVNKALQKISGCSNHSCDASDVPDVMINTEIWVPPGYQYGKWLDKKIGE